METKNIILELRKKKGLSQEALAEKVHVTRQVPRFSYEKSYGDNVVEHKTLFYTVVQKNPGTSEETVEILQ